MLTWLGAALAFSLSMIVFSTIISALTEALHRSLRLRERGLENMLEKLFAETIGDRTRRTELVKELTRNLTVGEPSGRLASLKRWLTTRSVTSLHWRELQRRVVESDAAGEILKGGSERALAALAVRYERFGVDATAFFQERARTISIGLAFAAAFALNVDAVALFSAFLKDPALAERVAASAEGTLRAYEESRADAEPAEASEEAAALEASIARFRAAADSPALAGLPVGAAYYPWCVGSTADPRCAAVAERRASEKGWWGAFLLLGAEIRPLVLWLLSILLSGFLMGLGGPFWFDAYRNLASIAGGAVGPRRRAEAVQKEDDASAAAPASPPGMFADPKEILEQTDRAAAGP